MRTTATPSTWLLPTVLVAMFMGQFDFFVVNVAAPNIQADLGASGGQLELIVAAYAVTSAAGLITGGRLGDIYGRKTVYATGVVLFAATSVLCALAPTAPVLIAARALQGLAAAVMLPQVLAIINTAIPEPQRPQAMGWFGVASGLGSIAGQGLGGFLIDLSPWDLQWRSIFLINLPIMAVTFFAALRFIPSAASPEPEPGSPDVPGSGSTSPAPPPNAPTPNAPNPHTPPAPSTPPASPPRDRSASSGSSPA